MSTSLYWAPPPAARKEKPIGYLKYIIGEHYEPGYNGGEINATAGDELIPFLKGVVAAAGKEVADDALELIAAIERFGTVELYTHC